MQFRGGFIAFATLCLSISAAEGKPGRKCRPATSRTSLPVYGTSSSLSSAYSPVPYSSSTTTSGWESWTNNTTPTTTTTTTSSISTIIVYPTDITTTTFETTTSTTDTTTSTINTTTSTTSTTTSTTISTIDTTTTTTGSTASTITADTTTTTDSTTSTIDTTTTTTDTTTTTTDTTTTTTDTTTTTTDTTTTTTTEPPTTTTTTVTFPPYPTFYLQAAVVELRDPTDATTFQRNAGHFAKDIFYGGSTPYDLLYFSEPTTLGSSRYTIDAQNRLYDVDTGKYLNTDKTYTSQYLYFDFPEYITGDYEALNCQLTSTYILSCTLGRMSKFSICFADDTYLGDFFFTRSPQGQGNVCREVTILAVPEVI